jgi:hypothetical protein
MTVFSHGACPFEVDLPAHEDIPCSVTGNNGCVVTTVFDRQHLRLWWLGENEESIDAPVTEYLSKRIDGLKQGEVEYRGPMKPGTHQSEPFPFTIKAEGELVFYTFMLTYNFPSGATVSSLHGMGVVRAEKILIRFETLEPFDKVKGQWLKVLQSCREKGDCGTAVDLLPDTLPDWIIPTRNKRVVTFRESAIPLGKPVTKFGGQPVW